MTVSPKTHIGGLESYVKDPTVYRCEVIGCPETATACISNAAKTHFICTKHTILLQLGNSFNVHDTHLTNLKGR